jgi:hypothetical protein
MYRGYVSNLDGYISSAIFRKSDFFMEYITIENSEPLIEYEKFKEDRYELISVINLCHEAYYAMNLIYSDIKMGDELDRISNMSGWYIFIRDKLFISQDAFYVKKEVRDKYCRFLLFSSVIIIREKKKQNKSIIEYLKEN